MLSDAIEGDLLHEGVVSNETNDAIAITEAISRPPKKLDVGIVQLADACR
jgi:hypothetical protein